MWWAACCATASRPSACRATSSNARFQGLRDLGVKFETNKVVGKTFTVPELLEDRGFDAAFVAAGAGAPSFLGIPGEFAGRVYSANEFLTRVNLMGGDRFPYQDTPVSLGDSVVVIGAGNTAMDCLRVSKRLGAPTVRCVYRRSEAEAPARIEELRHAKEEGIDFFFLHSPVEIYTDEAGDVKGMRVQKMELGEPDDQGRRRPVPLDEFLDLECDTVIYALGTNANPIVTQSTPGLGLNKWGYIVADDATQATNLPGVFAGGDIVTGGATVILAMGAGRRAAKAIGAYLSGDRKWPVTLEDAEAFVPEKPLVGADSQTQGGAMLCPKCHRPLEGDEEYICCADSELQWRCTDCGKVSEGFAFPYGMCPYCGGKLEVGDPARVEDGQGPGGHPLRLRDRARRARFLQPGGRAGGGSRAQDLLRQVRRDGERAHGNALQALPCRSAGAVGRLPDQARGDLRRARGQAGGSGQPVPDRHRVREARRDVL